MADVGLVPCLRPVGESTQFVMDGRPRLLLGGQLHNSTGSSPSHVREVLPRLAADGIRTVLGSASWAQLEPVEGAFDPTSVEVQLEAARTHGMHLVLIWFGAFKNAASTYAPSWVRQDPERFPRAVLRGGKPFAFTYPGAMPKPVLSVFLRSCSRRTGGRLSG